MNNQEWIKHKLTAKIQSAVLVASLTLLLGLIGWTLGGDRLAFMLIAGVVIFYLASSMMSPAITLRLNSGRRLSRSEAPRLYGALQDLARKAEMTRLPVLFYLPTNAMMAFTFGSRNNAAIAISDGLIRGLSRQELTAVLAHEVSHIRHSDTRIMVFAGLASQVTGLLSLLVSLCCF